MLTASGWVGNCAHEGKPRAKGFEILTLLQKYSLLFFGGEGAFEDQT
jgi:hypothetical protein